MMTNAMFEQAAYLDARGFPKSGLRDPNKLIETVKIKKTGATLKDIIYSPIAKQDKLHEIYDELMACVLNYKDIKRAVEYATDSTKSSFGGASRPASVTVTNPIKFPFDIPVVMEPNRDKIINPLYPRDVNEQLSQLSEYGKMYVKVLLLPRVIPYRISGIHFEDEPYIPSVEICTTSFYSRPQASILININKAIESPVEKTATEKAMKEWTALLKKFDVKTETIG